MKVQRIEGFTVTKKLDLLRVKQASDRNTMNYVY
jgi:hypothetical protein